VKSRHQNESNFHNALIFVYKLVAIERKSQNCGIKSHNFTIRC